MITLIEQAKVSLTYERRLAILYRLTGDVKKAKKLLSKHESSLRKSHKTLFGIRFYKALRKATKIRKSSKEISSHIGASGGKQQGSQLPSHRSRGASKAAGSIGKYQPFRQTPSSQRSGGGSSISFQARTNSFKGYSKRKSFVIRFTTKKRSPESSRAISVSNFAHSAPSGGIAPTNCPKGHSPNSVRPGTGHIHSKTIPPFCWETKALPEQLEVINTGPVYSTSGNRGDDTLQGISLPKNHSTSSVSQSTGEGIDQERNKNNVREGSNSGGLSTKRGVYKFSISSHQKGWGEPTYNKPQEPKFAYSL